MFLHHYQNQIDMTASQKRWTYYLTLFLFYSLFLSCSFEFSEDHFVHLEQPESNALMTVSILENNMTISQPITSNYIFNGNDRHRLYNVNIAIDNQGILGSTENNGAFEINPDPLPEGEHEITIRFQYSSGSKSLADLNELERYEGILRYTVIVDKSVPKPINILGVEVIDGSIYVNWNSSDDNIFQEAYLNVYPPDDYPARRKIELNQEIINSLQFNDTISTDLAMDFSITLKNRYGETEGERINLTLEKPNMYGEIIDGSSYKFIWEEHPLYNNFENYSYNVRPNNTFVTLSNRGGEYLVNDAPTFGQQEYHSLYLQRNNSGLGLHHVSERIHFGKTFEVPWGKTYVFNKERNSIFTVVLDGSSSFNAPRDVILYELDRENLQVLNSKNLFTIYDSYVDLTINPLTNDLIIDLFDSSLIVESSSLNIKETFESTDYVSPSNFIFTRLRNKFLIIERYNGSDVSIYNTETDQLLYQDTVDYRFFIADDGSALFNQGTIYLLNNESYEAIKVIERINNVSAHEVIFIPEKQLCVYSNVNGNPVIYNYGQNTSTIVSEITNIYNIKYDAVNEKLSMFQRDYDSYQIDMAYLVNLNGQVEKSLECFENNTALQYYPLDGKLISNQGIFLDTYFN